MSSLDPLSVYLINAFTTTTPHSGNQAGVVIFPANDPRATDDAYKLRVAKDINYSETAFLFPISPGRWNLRWFTPEVEVPLCGHATLASARVLFSLDPTLSKITFENPFAGLLHAQRLSDEKNATRIRISLPTWDDQVLRAVNDKSARATQDLRGKFAGALGVGEGDVVDVGPYPYGEGTEGVVVQIREEVDLKGLKVDAKAFAPFTLSIVTQLQSSLSSPNNLKIRSRVFVAPLGIDEDPVTGSAHAYLTAYYLLTSAKDKIPPSLVPGNVGDVVIDAEQVSERGGKLECRFAEGSTGVVEIVGSAAETMRGTLSVW